MKAIFRKISLAFAICMASLSVSAQQISKEQMLDLMKLDAINISDFTNGNTVKSLLQGNVTPERQQKIAAYLSDGITTDLAEWMYPYYAEHITTADVDYFKARYASAAGQQCAAHSRALQHHLDSINITSMLQTHIMGNTLPTYTCPEDYQNAFNAYYASTGAQALAEASVSGMSAQMSADQQAQLQQMMERVINSTKIITCNAAYTTLTTDDLAFAIETNTSPAGLHLIEAGKLMSAHSVEIATKLMAKVAEILK